jgi:hypothetical protein
VVVNANSSAGLLVGGPAIALLGAEETLVISGLLTAAVAIGVLAWRRRANRAGDSTASLTGCA